MYELILLITVVGCVVGMTYMVENYERQMCIDRIEQLEAKNQRYRMALEKIVTMPKSHEAVRLAVMVLENKDE